MSDGVIFLTHAEVEIDPEVPVPEWGLSAVGRGRHARFATDPALDGVRSIYASTERKAVEGATAVAEATGLAVTQDQGLGENDRSATGYLPPDEFWPVVEQFFGAPDVSVRGWETARDAQARIVAAVERVLRGAPAEGDVLIVSHGGVGTLLRCHLAGTDITKDNGQPHPGGGCWFTFGRAMDAPASEWSAI